MRAHLAALRAAPSTATRCRPSTALSAARQRPSVPPVNGPQCRPPTALSAARQRPSVPPAYGPQCRPPTATTLLAFSCSAARLFGARARHTRPSTTPAVAACSLGARIRRPQIHGCPYHSLMAMRRSLCNDYSQFFLSIMRFPPRPPRQLPATMPLQATMPP